MVGGRWTNKAAPDIQDGDLGFANETVAVVGPPCDWDRRTVKLWGTKTTFERSVETDDDGDTVTTVTSDCDPPDMMLLARKGDAAYWSGNTWFKHYEDRRTWTADIAVNMLTEGLVATGYSDGDGGIHAAMTAASSPRSRTAQAGSNRHGPHALTAVVAQIRGLRLLQSMVGPTADGWWGTTLGGYDVPTESRRLLDACFGAVCSKWLVLPAPPAVDTDPPHVLWGPQRVAGHATVHGDDELFVGEHSDLLWRALTETDLSGSSPLKNKLRDRSRIRGFGEDMVVAAALYDETAATQLTTGLFDAAPDWERRHLRDHVLELFNDALNPKTPGGNFGSEAKPSRWKPEQQNRIRGFINIVEALQP